MVTVIDRVGILNTLSDFFKADTGTLYGTSKHLQLIEYDPVKFENSKADNSKPFGLYMWISNESTVGFMARNSDELYEVSLRFVGIKSDFSGVFTQIDNAYERIKYLVNEQMYLGTMLTGYYSVSSASAQIINIEATNSQLTPAVIETENRITFDANAAIAVTVNRTYS